MINHIWLFFYRYKTRDLIIIYNVLITHYARVCFFIHLAGPHVLLGSFWTNQFAVFAVVIVVVAGTRWSTTDMVKGQTFGYNN